MMKFPKNADINIQKYFNALPFMERLAGPSIKRSNSVDIVQKDPIFLYAFEYTTENRNFKLVCNIKGSTHLWTLNSR